MIHLKYLPTSHSQICFGFSAKQKFPEMFPSQLCITHPYGTCDHWIWRNMYRDTPCTLYTHQPPEVKKIFICCSLQASSRKLRSMMSFTRNKRKQWKQSFILLRNEVLPFTSRSPCFAVVSAQLHPYFTLWYIKFEYLVLQHYAYIKNSAKIE